MNFDGLAGNDWLSVKEIDPGGPDDHFINSWGSSATSIYDLKFPDKDDLASLGGDVTLGDDVTVKGLDVGGSLTGDGPNAAITLTDGHSVVMTAGAAQGHPSQRRQPHLHPRRRRRTPG